MQLVRLSGRRPSSKRLERRSKKWLQDLGYQDGVIENDMVDGFSGL